MLNLEHDRDDHRPASGLSLNVAFEIEPDLFLDDGPIHALFVAGVGHGLADDDSCPAKELEAVVAYGQAALDDFGGGFQLARGLIDGDDGQHDSVISQVLPIPQHELVYTSRARIIYQGASHGRFVRDSRAGLVELDDVAALGEHDVVARDAPFAGGFGVAVKLAGLAVNRDQEFGPHGVVHN